MKLQIFPFLLLATGSERARKQRRIKNEGREQGASETCTWMDSSLKCGRVVPSIICGAVFQSDELMHVHRRQAAVAAAVSFLSFKLQLLPPQKKQMEESFKALVTVFLQPTNLFN